MLGLDSLRNIPRSSLTASPTSLLIASGMGIDWQALVSEVDGGTNLLLGLDYQTFSQSEISIEVLLSINQFDVTELAYHQRESPDLPPMLIWDVREDRELVETSLRHWFWLADAWTKLTGPDPTPACRINLPLTQINNWESTSSKSLAEGKFRTKFHLQRWIMVP